MDITTLRKQTAASRVSKEAREEAWFMASPLKEYIDQKIQEDANEGENKTSFDFYYIKKRVLGYEYSGPTIDAVIRHYRNEGFLAYSKTWLSPNGDENLAIVISW